jgi:putative membrane protein
MDNVNKLLSAAVVALAAATGTALAQQGGQTPPGSAGSPPGAMQDQSGTATSPRTGQTSPRTGQTRDDRGAMKGDRTAEAGSARLSSKTQKFVHDAMMGNMFEIESSQAVLQKSQNQDVQRFAQHLVDDHRKADDQMHQVLQRIGYTGALAQAPRGDRGAGQGQPTRGYRGDGRQQTSGVELDRAHEKKVQQIERDTGAKVDRDFVKMQVDAHKKTINLFKSYAQNGDNQDLKQFAQDTLPTLEEHLRMAQQLQSNSGRSGKSGKGARS